MLDYDALSVQFDELLYLFTADDLQEWLDFDKKRILQEHLEELEEINAYRNITQNSKRNSRKNEQVNFHLKSTDFEVGNLVFEEQNTTKGIDYALCA